MQSDKDVIASCFSKAVETYDAYAEFQFFAAEKLVSYINNISPKHILDIGCGTGILTSLLKKKFPYTSFTLLDISPKMLEKARLKLGINNIHYVCGLADDIDLIKTIIKQYNIDMIVSSLCLQWIKNPSDLITAYQNYAPTYVTILLEQSFYQWYESIKKICPDFTEPVSLLSSDVVSCRDEYHIQYANGLAFLQAQKKLGTLANHYKPYGVKQIKQACNIFETDYKSIISYYLGIVSCSH